MCPQFDSGSCHHAITGAAQAPVSFMKYLIKNIRIPVLEEQNPESRLAKILGKYADDLQSCRISRRALDCRTRNQPFYVYTLEISCNNTMPNHRDIVPCRPEDCLHVQPKKLSDPHPCIIGMGPAGLFCALAMVENGLQPVLFDRGEAMHSRAIAINKFWSDGHLDLESNVQFGEGGAGAFSDGKLTARSSGATTRKVFDLLIRFGAPDSIAREALPHLGTERIRQITTEIREYLRTKGCSFLYRSRLDDLLVEGEAVTGISVNNQIFRPELTVLSVGNAARDTFRMLSKRGVALQAKPFAVGFRISHHQQWINTSIYGDEKWAQILGAASYRMTAPKAGKGTYTFCMCPGGYVIAASSESEGMVTNGMSFASRRHEFGNAAIVTAVNEADYGHDLFAGLQFQQAIEHKAYHAGYAMPWQLAADYLRKRLSQEHKVDCLSPTTISANISELFPTSVNAALEKGLCHFDKILPGFIQEGIILAPETRTSSPLRVIRDRQNLHCHGISNLYAIGEGVGYTGGIISSAADGYLIGSRFSG